MILKETLEEMLEDWNIDNPDDQVDMKEFMEIMGITEKDVVIFDNL